MPPRNLTLKQRLAALSATPSSPVASTIPDSPRSSSSLPGRRKPVFNPLWTRRQAQDAALTPDQRDAELLQDVMSRMIFQAGVDFETRPMVVMNASALPDPRDVSYDLLLQRILAYLNLYVESDYTLVFFAAGGKNSPGWNWVWKAYRSLSRKYRKNLKRLYIVHSSFFSKMLFSLAGAIISPKFFRKLVYIPTLSDLAYHVPLTQIDIPPAVYQENLKHEKKIMLPLQTRSNVFGVPLEDMMGYDGERGTIPRVVKDSIQYIRDAGLQEDGLFRRSPQSVLLRAAQDAYDRGNVVSLDTFGDPHLAAVLIKKYLRDLPEPVFPESIYPTICRCPPPSADPADISSVLYVREVLLPELVPCAYILLSHVLHLLHDVSLHSSKNRMDAHNLALVLSPNLVKSPSPTRDVMMCAVPGGPTLFQSSPTPPPPTNQQMSTTLGMVMKLCIQRYYEIFDEVRDRGEAVRPILYDADRDLPVLPVTQESPKSSPEGYSWENTVSSDHQNGHTATGEANDRDDEATALPRFNTGPRPQRPPSSTYDDDESIDDGMLVMPIGPTHRSNKSLQINATSTPPSAWGLGGTPSNQGGGYANGGGNTKSLPPLNPAFAGVSSSARSMHAISTDANGHGSTSTGEGGVYPATFGKARSMISIDSGTFGGGAGKRGSGGSIAIGRGTTRKAKGAGVEAIGVTAEGFFTAPGDAPPIPGPRGSS